MLIDEIAREIRIGWSLTGELVVLYVALLIQVAYCVLVLRAIRSDVQGDVSAKVLSAR